MEKITPYLKSFAAGAVVGACVAVWRGAKIGRVGMAYGVYGVVKTVAEKALASFKENLLRDLEPEVQKVVRIGFDLALDLTITVLFFTCVCPSIPFALEFFVTWEAAFAFGRIYEEFDPSSFIESYLGITAPAG